MYALSQFVPLLNLWCRTQVRGKIREQKGIEGTCIKDLLMVWCCPPCSLVQEARVGVADCMLYEICNNLSLSLSLSLSVLGIESTWIAEHVA